MTKKCELPHGFCDQIVLNRNGQLIRLLATECLAFNLLRNPMIFPMGYKNLQHCSITQTNLGIVLILDCYNDLSCVSQLYCILELPGLLKHGFLSPITKVSNSVGCDLKMCIFNKSSGDANTTGPGTIL